MATTLTAESDLLARAQALLLSLRAGERVAVIFFLYLAALAWTRQLGAAQILTLVGLPVVISFAASAESSRSAPWSRAVRDWLTMGLILAGYWSIGWFASPPLAAWQEVWVGWDRLLLDTWGFRASIESAGALFPSLLETLYLLLYSVPPICICFVYRFGGRIRVNQFLFTLMLGTFAAYALLPLIPVHGPRIAYPGLDLPNIYGLSRSWNVWVLDHMDIPTSVFPSGHVAVAFSTAFGMLRAVRSRPGIWAPVFVVAIFVYAATIYCRYHYAVDGLASIGITALAWRVSSRGGPVA